MAQALHGTDIQEKAMKVKKNLILPFYSLLLAVFLIMPPDISLAQDLTGALWPENSLYTVYYDGKLQVDASHTGDGYFYASVPSGSRHKLKLRVAKDGTTLTYDLSGEGNSELFPLQLGSGSYQVSLYENVSGKKYAQEGRVDLWVSLNREDIAFLYPNQYVNYSLRSLVTAMADELAAGQSSARGYYDAVQSYMQTDFLYDYIKSVTVAGGALPDIEGCCEKRMGICQDLSAVMVAMLRQRGVPARLMIGYADNNYHAWTTATVDGEEIFFDPTAALNAIAKPKDYTLERYY